MKNIVIDVTTLIKWRRYPVGIIRTLLEFVKYSKSHIHNVKYVRFSEDKSRIEIVPEDEVALLLKEYEDESWNNYTISTNFINVERKRKLVDFINIFRSKDYLRLCKIIYNKLPSSIGVLLRKISEPMLRKIIVKANNNDNNNMYTALFCPEKIICNDSVGIIGYDDILITIGLDWDNSNYPMLIELKKQCKFEVVTCFYDAIPITHSDLVHSSFFGKIFSYHLYKLLCLSDKVFCISNYSKKTLEKYIKDNLIDTPAKLKTIYLGDDVNVRNIESNKIKESYVLYVSTIEARKNHVLLLRVWKKLIEKYGKTTPKLILVGMHGWGIEEFYNELKTFPKEYLEIRSNVSDKELTGLYQNCFFGVFPSIVEGWGLGAAECLSYGKVCIVSDCDAIYEATQKLMPTLPNDINRWVDQLSIYIENPNLISELERLICDEYKPKTWSEFSREFKEFILE